MTDDEAAHKAARLLRAMREVGLDPEYVVDLLAKLTLSEWTAVLSLAAHKAARRRRR